MKDQLEAQWQAIKIASGEGQRAAFLRYCELVLVAVAQGELSETEGAYQICGISGQVLEHLTSAELRISNMACDLELPVRQRAHPERSWSDLAEAVREVLHP